MEKYFTIEQSNHFSNGWNVVCFRNKYVEGLETPEIAEKVAEALNLAYQEGREYEKDGFKEKLNKMFFE